MAFYKLFLRAIHYIVTLFSSRNILPSILFNSLQMALYKLFLRAIHYIFMLFSSTNILPSILFNSLQMANGFTSSFSEPFTSLHIHVILRYKYFTMNSIQFSTNGFLQALSTSHSLHIHVILL